MAHEEAAFSEKQHQHQHQNQRPFTAEPLHGADADDAMEGEAVQQQANALALKLAQTYEELTRLLERNPGVKRQMTEGTAKEDKVYQKLKQRLKLADMAPRCRWVRQGGTSCGSPQMKKHIYCFAHMQMAEARDLMLKLPPLEDANAIQVGLMRIQKSLIEDTISTKKAGLLLYSMQLALTNVGQTTFGQAKDEEMVRETVDEEEAFNEEAFSGQRSAISQDQPPPRRHGSTEEEKSQNQNQNTFTAKDAKGAKGAKEKDQNQRPFTTEDTKDTEEDKGLPLMNADERGLEMRIKPVQWKPTPDMYRSDTPEGREAYEASVRMTMAPQLGAERKLVQAVIPPQPAQERRGPGAPVIAPEEHSETCAVVG